jgi:hypothetical protein
MLHQDATLPLINGGFCLDDRWFVRGVSVAFCGFIVG